MIYWLFRLSRGCGILIPVLFFVELIISELLLRQFFPDATGAAKLAIMLASNLLCFALPVFIIGRKVNRGTFNPHTFLFIRLESWAAIVPIILTIKNWP